MSELPESSLRVFEFIKDYISERGFPPTMQEISDYFGFHSKSTAHQHVHRLKNFGYIELGPSKRLPVVVLR
jgi:repressor LexA